LNNEVRYSSLKGSNPDRAEMLFDKSEKTAKERYEHLLKLIEIYK